MRNFDFNALTIAQGLRIQGDDLARWKLRLNAECYASLAGECALHNAMLTSTDDGYSVFRGGPMVAFVDAWVPTNPVSASDMIALQLAAAQEKIANQSERIRYLEGATNHATGTPLSQAHAKIAALETQLEAHAWTVSPAMAQAQIDALNAQIYRLRAALIKIAHMTRHEWSANVAAQALEGQP